MSCGAPSMCEDVENLVAIESVAILSFLRDQMVLCCAAPSLEFVFLDLSAPPEVSAAVYASTFPEWTMDAPLATVPKSLGG